MSRLRDASQLTVKSESEKSHRLPLELIGVGGSRWCFAHPEHPDLCIKVGHKRRGKLQTPRERRYLRRVFAFHSQEPTSHLTAIHTSVNTSAGVGWLVDRVRDEAGNPWTGQDDYSPTLAAAFGVERFTAEASRWEAAFEEFVQWASNTAVLVRDLKPENVCVRRLRDGRYRLILVDGVGPAGLVRRCLPTHRYARRRNLEELRHRQMHSPGQLAHLCDRSRKDATLGNQPSIAPVFLVRG